ncbi:MAG: (2Fe-2S) ferredoxin domain-containing protein [Proteobacteria bacterium]|nr:(2Fe-2S) ferredoxin domain-containing protein [Pseudomonadota bacterium]
MGKKLYDVAMVLVDSQTCKVAVFVCVNDRQTERASCAKVGGLEFYQQLKEKVKTLGLYNTHWITRTGCLGFCNSVGTTVAVFKKGQDPIWYNEVKMEHLETIWKEITS